MFRQFIGTMACAALAFLVGSPTSWGQSSDAGPKAGDRWTYEVTDNVTGDLRRTFTVLAVEVSKDEINTRVSFRGNERPRQIVYTPSWGRIDDGAWKFKPHDGQSIPDKLQVGAEWKFENSASSLHSGAVLSASGQGKVVSRETVKTAAGDFETYQIEYQIRQYNANDASKGSMTKTVMWIAPIVNRWVKRTIEVRVEGRLRESNTEVLTEYSRKP